MLPPIPRRILTDTASFSVPTGFDVYQTPTYTTYEVKAVHVQNTNETKKTAENTEVVLRSVLFIDGRLSSPKLDYMSLQAAAQSAGGVMKVTIGAEAYTVLTVDAVPDDTGRLHHYELGLV